MGRSPTLTASRRIAGPHPQTRGFFGGDFPLPSFDTKEQEVKGYRLVGRSIEPITIEVKKKEPLRAELESFLECVRDRTKPLVTGEDGMEAVALAARVAEAVETSMRRWKR